MLRALAVIRATGSRIPLRLGQALGRALGTLAWHLLRRERRKALANIARAFPEMGDAGRRRHIKAMFRHLGMSLFEFVWLPNLRDPKTFARLTRVENAEPTLALLREGKGMMAFTGHCGNWEWDAYTVGLLGMPLYALQRERDEREMNRFITDIRETAGVKTIDRGSSASSREMIAALRRGGMLAFLIDQNIRAESVKVPFFGIPALTPVGPCRLAVRTEVPLVAIFDQRLPDGTHHVRFTDPIPTSRGDDPVALTARLTAEIEAQIRRAPEQWVWMHDRWRERPEWEIPA